MFVPLDFSFTNVFFFPVNLRMEYGSAMFVLDCVHLRCLLSCGWNEINHRQITTHHQLSLLSTETVKSEKGKHVEYGLDTESLSSSRLYLDR